MRWNYRPISLWVTKNKIVEWSWFNVPVKEYKIMTTNSRTLFQLPSQTTKSNREWCKDKILRKWLWDEIMMQRDIQTRYNHPNVTYMQSTDHGVNTCVTPNWYTDWGEKKYGRDEFWAFCKRKREMARGNVDAALNSEGIKAVPQGRCCIVERLWWRWERWEGIRLSEWQEKKTCKLHECGQTEKWVEICRAT